MYLQDDKAILVLRLLLEDNFINVNQILSVPPRVKSEFIIENYLGVDATLSNLNH